MATAEPTIVTVKMDDERIVEFAGKRKMIKTPVVEDGVVKVRFDFKNGETRLFTVPDSLLQRFIGYGAAQKIGDETAGCEDVEDFVLAVDAITDRFNRGEWSVKRESNSMAGTSILAKALVELSGKNIAEIKSFLVTKSHAEKVALRQSVKIRPIIERLEAEKAGKGKPKAVVDTDALLGELA